MMTMRLMLAALFAAPLLMFGCNEPEAEEAVQKSLGVEEGSESETVKTEQERLIYEEERRLRDADTGKVIAEELEKAPVTIEQQTVVKKDTKIEAGETTESKSGDIPDDIENDAGSP